MWKPIADIVPKEGPLYVLRDIDSLGRHNIQVGHWRDGQWRMTDEQRGGEYIADNVVAGFEIPE